MQSESRYKWLFELNGRRHIAVVTGSPNRQVVADHLRQILADVRTIELEILRDETEIDLAVAALRQQCPDQPTAPELFPDNPNRIFHQSSPAANAAQEPPCPAL